MGYSPWMCPRHSNSPLAFLCRFSCNLSSWKWSSLITCCCARLIQKSLHAVISCVNGGPWIFSKGCWQLRMKRETQAQTLRALCTSNFSRTRSRSSLILIAAGKIFRWIFLSASLCWLACVTISSGQLVRSANHSRPLHHSCTSVTLPPRLPRSAGFSVEGTWRHWVFGWLWIFRTRFVTNWRYSPWSRNQCNATVLSNQQIVPFCGKWEPVDCFLHLEIHKFFEIRKLHYRDRFCQ